VCLITYNQEMFVRAAIESVLAQRTSFDSELVIGDDASTDRTTEIVAGFARRYPERIRVLRQESNQGLLRNFHLTLNACRGKYVALLDGDDYWTATNKLETQVRFLVAHPECSLCFHDVAVLQEDGRFCTSNYTSPLTKRTSEITDLFETNFIATCSAVFRREAINEFPSWYQSCLWEDWPLYMLLAQQGTITYFNEVMAVYRSHGRGLWSALDMASQVSRTIEFLTAVDRYLDFRYRDAIQSSIEKHRRRLNAIAAPTEPNHG
jgi:glycosyltransferase involved in cell wall biosynthesis